MKNLKEKILQYGSFIFIFLVPIIFWNNGLFPHISSKTFFIYMGIEALFFVWIYALIVDNSYRIPKKSFIYFLPLIIFVVWMTISGIFGVNPSFSFWSSLSRGTGLLTLYHALIFSFIIFSLVRKYGLSFIATLFQWFIGGSFILALSVWLGTEGFNLPFKALSADIGGGLTGNSTLTAGYFLFTLAISFFLLNIKSLSIFKKWFIGITIALVLFSPVFVDLYSFFAGQGILGSARGTLLAITVGVGAVFLSYMFISKIKVIRLFSIITAFIGIIVFSFLWIQLVTPDTSLNQKFSEQARGSRFIFWNIASKSMNEHPILGYGPENYPIAFQENFDSNILVVENSFEGWNDRAHNLYYDIGVSGGYPAIFFYSIFLLSIFYVFYRLYKFGQLSRINTSILSGLLVAYLCNNLFTFDSNLLIVSLFMISGIVYALDFNKIKEKPLSLNINQLNKNLIASIFFIFFIGVSIVFVFMPAHKSKIYAETFTSSINKRPSMYPELLTGSHIGEDWDASNLAYTVYKQYALNPIQIKSDKQKLPYIIADIDSILDYLYKLSENNKTNYRLYITIALMENTRTYLSDKPYDIETQNRILDILNKAKSLSQTNPNTYWVMAQTKVWGGDIKGAEQSYKDAIAINPDLADSHKLFIRFIQIIGDHKLYNEAIKQAEKDIPGFVETYGKELNII